MPVGTCVLAGERDEDEYTRLYGEARVRLAIGATLAACLLLISMATPWVNIDGHNPLVWDISYPPAPMT